MNACASHSQTQQTANKNTVPLPEIYVNKVLISEADLANELQYHPHSDFNQVIQQAGQTLVVRELLLQEAKHQAIDISQDNEEQALQKLMADSINPGLPSESDCVRYFENNPQKFTTMPLMEVDHILLAAAPDDLTARETAKHQAQRIIQQLETDPLLFPALAKQYSACPSKATGGNLGQLSKGQTVPEFERQLMTLPQGLGRQPIESRYGLHIVNITRKIEGQPMEYAMVADKIKGYLTHRASYLAIQAFIQSLVEKAEITGISLCFMEENIHL